MRLRNVAGLALALALFAGILGWLHERQQPPAQPPASRAWLPGLKPHQVTALCIATPGQPTIRARRDGKDWTLASKDGYPASGKPSGSCCAAWPTRACWRKRAPRRKTANAWDSPTRARARPAGSPWSAATRRRWSCCWASAPRRAGSWSGRPTMRGLPDRPNGRPAGQRPGPARPSVDRPAIRTVARTDPVLWQRRTAEHFPSQ